jgi:hypothetical protein
VADPSDPVTGTKGDVKPGQYADLLSEMLKKWDYDTDNWRDIRDEGQTDMRFVAGNPWDNDDRQLREDAGRPVMSFDEIGQYVNQTINDIRQHKRAIKVTPIGEGANDQTAEFRQNLIRQIEYRSNAQQAYTSMFENAVQRSYGFLRVKSRYVSQPKASGGSGSGFDQELVIEAIPNPDLVTFDSDSIKPDGSDAQRAWISESWDLSTYKKRFPKARIQDFDANLAKTIPSSWVYNQNRIQLAEYWLIENEPRTLLLFKRKGQPLEVFADDLKNYPKALQDAEPDDERQVDAPAVRKYLTNGFEVLEPPTTWPGTTLPIVPCYGKILYVDEGSGSTRKILSLPRLARDPAMLLSYYRSCEAEVVGMTPKTPWVGYTGQFRGHETEWQKVYHEPVAFLEANPTTEGTGTQVLPLPQRQVFEPPIQALEVGAEAARRAIQAAMGISPLPTSAQRRNDKSGVALQQIHDSEQQGSFHFVDNYEMSITRVGAILDEVIPVYYDTPRTVTTRTPEGEPQVVRINDSAQLAPDQTTPIMVSQSGQHDVTLSTGPDFKSEREAASAFADTLMASNMAPIVADLAVKLKNIGPIGDAMAERLHAMLPPPVLALDKGKQADPAQLVGQLAQASQMIQMLSKELTQRTQQIETDWAKQQGQIELEKLKQQGEAQRSAAEVQTTMFIERMKVIATLLATDAKIDPQRAKLEIDAAIAELDRHVEIQAQLSAQQHEKDMQAAEHAHQADLAQQQIGAQADQQQTQIAADQDAQATDLAAQAAQPESNA